MCLGIPGKIIEMWGNDLITKMGKVSFSGAIKEVSLAYVPEAEIGDYVIIHAGFAISMMDETQANEVFEYLRQIEEANNSELRL